MAVQGPVIGWVADHRKHHAYTDEEGDPHSPHVGHGGGAARQAARALARARGLAVRDDPGSRGAALRPRPARGPRDALRSTATSSGSSPAASACPSAWATPFTGTLGGALTALLWGGFVRVFFAAPRDLEHQLDLPLLRPPALRDRRRVHERLLARAALARRGLAPQPPRLPALGLAWPALVGARRRRLVIGAMKRVDLAWNVVRIPPERQAQRLTGAGYRAA